MILDGYLNRGYIMKGDYILIRLTELVDKYNKLFNLNFELVNVIENGKYKYIVTFEDKNIDKRFKERFRHYQKENKIKFTSSYCNEPSLFHIILRSLQESCSIEKVERCEVKAVYKLNLIRNEEYISKSIYQHEELSFLQAPDDIQNRFKHIIETYNQMKLFESQHDIKIFESCVIYRG